VEIPLTVNPTRSIRGLRSNVINTLTIRSPRMVPPTIFVRCARPSAAAARAPAKTCPKLGGTDEATGTGAYAG
jgi:hypothetical protein